MGANNDTQEYKEKEEQKHGLRIRNLPRLSLELCLNRKLRPAEDKQQNQTPLLRRLRIFYIEDRFRPQCIVGLLHCRTSALGSRATAEKQSPP
jgi:hypothetical protein